MFARFVRDVFANIGPTYNKLYSHNHAAVKYKQKVDSYLVYTTEMDRKKQQNKKLNY